MQFLHTARIIESFCVEHWDGERSAIMRAVVLASIGIHAFASSANSIYPENQEEAKTRRLMLKMALACVYVLKHQISVAYRARKLSTGVQKELNEHLEHEKALLKGMIKKDKERYKGLPL